MDECKAILQGILDELKELNKKLEVFTGSGGE